MARACDIENLTMGAGTWATVALEQGLPYFGVALTDTRCHEVMDHLKGMLELPKMGNYCVGE